jgi:hypothetical protein
MMLLFLAAGPLITGLVLVYLRIYRFADRTLVDVIPYVRHVDLAVIRNLMDAADEYYLRLNLSETQFRKAQQRRMKLLLEQLGRMSHNSRILLEWGRNDWRKGYESNEKPWEDLSAELVHACLHFRMGAISIKLVILRWLMLSAILPWIKVGNISSLCRFDSFDLFTTYDKLRIAAENLSRAYGELLREKLVNML